jgi:hypothetical protein
MKRCDVCKESRPIELFDHNRSKKDGLHTTCKECRKRLNKEYIVKNKEKIQVKRRKYYLDNKELISRKVCAWAKDNRIRHNLNCKTARDNLKTEVFSHYCGGEVKCHCNEADLGLLTMDHVHGGGNKHRKEVGTKTGYNFYSWLKKNSFPDGFQVLCWNCNFKKRNQEMAPSNPSKRQVQKSDYRKLVKQQCLERYGIICPCGEDDKDVLTLDHVNDDGAAHRMETGTRGFNFYIYLRKNGFPNNPPLQVLCLKCQYRKRIANEERKSIAV